MNKQAKASLENIRIFMENRDLAIIGISRQSTKFGNAIYKELKAKDYRLFPVHSSMDAFDGDPCYRDIVSLPDELTHLIICTKPENTLELAIQAA